MPSQLLSEQSIGVDAFVALVKAHATVTRQLNAQLAADHGLTISDYEVLLRLARAPDRRLRRVDLAEQVLLTPSGITRLLDGLERQGWVGRASCEEDRRVVYAVLTGAGLEKLRDARTSHAAQIEEHFARRLGHDELSSLVDLLARLGDAIETPPCDPEAEASPAP
jgi:DNA-binding MarR family transcriptional regulator